MTKEVLCKIKKQAYGDLLNGDAVKNNLFNLENVRDEAAIYAPCKHIDKILP